MSAKAGESTYGLPNLQVCTTLSPVQERGAPLVTRLVSRDAPVGLVFAAGLLRVQRRKLSASRLVG